MYDFPASPAIGQVSNGYVWNGYAWAGNGASITDVAPPSETPPASPVNGQLWWESDTGNLFVWYVDANSSQWVQISGPGLGDAPVDGNRYVRRSGVWTSIGPGSVVVATATASQLAVAIPAGARRCRMTGYLKPGSLTTNIGFRVSKDGALSWLDGGTDYRNSQILQTATSVTGAGYNSAFGFAATASTTATMATRALAVEFLIPDASEVMTWSTASMGYGSTEINNVQLVGYVNVGGPYTHFLLTGDAPPYTLTGRVIAEFDA